MTTYNAPRMTSDKWCMVAMMDRLAMHAGGPWSFSLTDDLPYFFFVSENAKNKETFKKKKGMSINAKREETEIKER